MRSWARAAVVTFAVGMGLVFAGFAIARYETFHNETFDLAFYARMAWGLARGDLWVPIVGAHVFGLHLSPVLVPLGALGAWLDTSHVLLVTQAAAVAAASWPLARIGVRHLGQAGAVVGAVALLLHPNLGHVATYEFHPGTVALVPLAWSMDALDRRDVRTLAWSVAGVWLCREDLALTTAVIGTLAWLDRDAPRPFQRAGLAVAGASAAYLGLFLGVLHPRYAPDTGSMEAHFGRWGETPADVVGTWIASPLELLAYLSTPARLAYLPKVLLPLALLPLAAPRWLLPAAPTLGIGLISNFPTTTDLDCHYTTPALPALAAGALVGAGRLARATPGRRYAAFAAMCGVATTAGYLAAGGTPGAARFDPTNFRPDARGAAASRVVAHIPPTASVQAPDALLPHLAERATLHRAPPPERKTDYVVLDASHRQRWRGQGTLLRTQQEPHVRRWLARPEYGLVQAVGPWLLLERGRSPRQGLGGQAVIGQAPPEAGTALTSCLGLLDATRRAGARITLELAGRGPCPNDLALRLGPCDGPPRIVHGSDDGPAEPGFERPTRVELPFAGLLNPSHIRAGDRLRSGHRVPGIEDADALCVGALRSSGARPAPDDPMAVIVRL